MMHFFEIAGAILFSIGSASLILFALSSWLGKIWASRILEKERSELELLKETYLKEHSEKITTYKSVVDVVSKILADLDKRKLGVLTPAEGIESFHDFNEQRLKVYGYLGMVAPQAVMDAQDALMGKILRVASGHETYEWSDIRALALNLINEIRKDIAIDKSPISYNGNM